ncbi:hypothetical protein [Janibacter terrae]|uniref:hypothetical protein n=1 Tax=Janibacter terrae TaxID=103817 RepID=UPI0031F9F068
MRSPEEVAREWEACSREEHEDGPACREHDLPWPCEDQAVLNFADLIRARDAEVRAETLAGFTEERKDLRDCGCRTPVGALWSCCIRSWPVVATERRLVGPWKPDPRTPEQRSDDAVDTLRERLSGERS